MNQSHDEKLKQFLKSNAPQAPEALADEWHQILNKVGSSSKEMTSIPVLKPAWWSFGAAGLLAASFTAAWIFVSNGSVDSVKPPIVVQSNQSEQWAAELISSELIEDDTLPANQIGEEYLNLLAENSPKQK